MDLSVILLIFRQHPVYKAGWALITLFNLMWSGLFCRDSNTNLFIGEWAQILKLNWIPFGFDPGGDPMVSYPEMLGKCLPAGE